MKKPQNILVTFIYLLLAFLSAFELFMIQPLMAKQILPWFGGAAAVWTACLLFFQVMLFIGYFYAYLISFAKLRTQVTAHISLICTSLGLLVWQLVKWGTPISPPRDRAISIFPNMPTLAVVTLLAVAVGLPYIMLSSTSPLIQSWFYGKDDDRKKPLYFFYAVSNIGSLLALLFYPLILEPLMGVKHQASAWSFGYIAFAAVCTACAIHAIKTSVAKAEPQTKQRNANSSVHRSSFIVHRSLAWLGLSAVATLMLIAVTNEICANVAPVPLLWLLPLSLYLLAFIICFSSHTTLIPIIAALIMLPATALTLFMMKHSLQLGIVLRLAAFLTALFCACMLCLGLLHKLRPHTEHLTFFYLMIALGGALGGIFTAVIAPLIFNDYWELRIGLMITCALAAWMLYPKPWMSAWKIPLIVATLAILATLSHMPEKKNLTTIEKSRSFYGVLKVIKEKQPKGVNVYSLMHGKICHGIQFDSGPFSRLPNAYFGPNSGIGVAFAGHPKRTMNDERGMMNEDQKQKTNDHIPMTTDKEPNPDNSMTVGIMGLGIGTIASYGEEGDHFIFYELCPDVVEMATNTAHFRYLSSCPANVDIILGDARLSLEKELTESGSRNFDILALDVFNGDAIPVHLLTLESFEVYLKHLNPNNGILALHITNMYLDLVPIVSGLAKYYDLHGYIVKGHGDMRITSDSLWILLSRNADFAVKTPDNAEITPLDTAGNPPVWTDDFSNIISIMKTGILVKGSGK